MDLYICSSLFKQYFQLIEHFIMSQTVVLKVSMSCQGCAAAVRRALTEIQGVESFDVNLKEQKVRVTISGKVQPQTIFEAVSKTGKTTSFWDFAAADGDL